MHQHLVDHHLEEQRRDEREELQEERGDQHLAEQPAILVDRAQEPGDVESARQIDSEARRAINTSPPFHTASNSARVITAGAAIDGCCTRTLSSPTLPSMQEAAVAQRRDAGQRRVGEARPSSVFDARAP